MAHTMRILVPAAGSLLILSGCSHSIPHLPRVGYSVTELDSLRTFDTAQNQNAFYVSAVDLRAAKGGGYLYILCHGPNAYENARLVGDALSRHIPEYISIYDNGSDTISIMNPERDSRDYVGTSPMTIVDGLRGASPPSIGPGVLAGPTYSVNDNTVVQTVLFRSDELRRGESYRVQLRGDWSTLCSIRSFAWNFERSLPSGELIADSEQLSVVAK